MKMKDQNNPKNQDGGDHGHGKPPARQREDDRHQDNQGAARGNDDNAGEEDIRQQRL